jgi:hypothetical protein
MILTLLSLILAANPAQEVAKVLDDWHLAAANANEDAYFAILDDRAIFLGTDATERWTKDEFRGFAHPYFAKGKAWTFKATRRAISFSPDGKVAWFDEDLHTENLGPCRGSGVLLLVGGGSGGQWKIVQYNLAFTIPNDKVDALKKLVETPTTKPAASERK